MKDCELTDIDIRILKFYKNGHTLNGFEGVHSHLHKLGYLDDDLNLTRCGQEYVKEMEL